MRPSRIGASTRVRRRAAHLAQGLCVGVQDADDALLAGKQQQCGARSFVERPCAAEKVLLRLRGRSGALSARVESRRDKAAMRTHVFVAVGLQRHNAAFVLRLVDGGLRRAGSARYAVQR